jgi:outer membrane protein assembly factor BamB
VVFGSDHGSFFALDSHTGKVLWQAETGGVIYAAPVTYRVDGEQFVSIFAGRSLMTFALPKADTTVAPQVVVALEGGRPLGH